MLPICQAGNDGNCSQCGRPLAKDLRRQCPSWKPGGPVAPVAVLKDYNRQNDGKLREVQSMRPACVHLGDRLIATETRTTGCSACWTPIYQCELYGLCTPLGTSVDSQLIHPCPGCDRYDVPDNLSHN